MTPEQLEQVKTSARIVAIESVLATLLSALTRSPAARESLLVSLNQLVTTSDNIRFPDGSPGVLRFTCWRGPRSRLRTCRIPKRPPTKALIVMATLNAAHFKNDDKARQYLEALRWPNGPVCPHCGSTGCTTSLRASAPYGPLKCKDCREQFSVTVGTVFERSKVSLSKWLLAVHLLCSSKKGMSCAPAPPHRSSVTYKTAWFMSTASARP